ncbi:hypothetical protein TEQG_07633 [Trichophyton equinum CBS 127.97]|uniref:Aminoglycoside phosphotransferase domain-containing protein n=1 Tax=Trichophyton equinum (strain ATCC MYA-4606 / CBS 127.97) TaxID=559882 RepID=F2Q3F6_TRIEC|nr:hypothetical protein TEQG_07633 [Trichophyton equinum CBS 127.97]
MAVPRHVARSASQLFLLDKESPQYKAYLAIADIPHPDRAILGAFIENASDSEKAAQFFLRWKGDGSELPPKKAVLRFLSDWKLILNTFRPVVATSLSDEEKKLIFARDGGQCCITQTPFNGYLAEGLEYAHIAPPTAFIRSPDLSRGGHLFDILSSFIPHKLLDTFLSQKNGNMDKLDNILLLSKTTFCAFQKGAVYLELQTWAKDTDISLKRSYSAYTNNFVPPDCDRLYLPSRTVHVVNRTPESTPIVSEELLTFHAHLSSSLAWMEAERYMLRSLSDCSKASTLTSPAAQSQVEVTKKSPVTRLITSFLSIFHGLWKSFPSFVRAPVYDVLVWIGSRMYGPTLSATNHKLPFGLYLRRGSPSLAPKYHVEAHTLKMIEQSTDIPAPRAIDVTQTSRYSYLLMTCVPGHPIGPSLNTMTDEEVEQVVVDLKGYISELRKIPRDSSSKYLICNSQGGGFLDWRIPDSQSEELRFKSEADFNKYLTDPFWEEIRIRAAKSHDTPHDIVFTHGDLNPRNILAENGRITGIVDWENAGWFPEYWEYTKMHYTVRSLERWLVDVVDSVFPGYREELWVENMLSDLLGPF